MKFSYRPYFIFMIQYKKQLREPMKVIAAFKIAILLSCSVLTGCSKFADSTIYQQDIIDKKNSLFVTKILVTYKDLLNQNGQYSGSMVIENTADNKLKYYIDGKSYTSAAIMIQPGQYRINNITWNNGSFKTSLYPGYKFYIKPGDCLYYGDIVIDSATALQGKNIKIVYNLNLAKDSFNSSKKLKIFSPKLKLYK